MKIIAKGLSILTFLIIGILFIVIVAYFFGIKPTIVISGSMAPKIPTGSLCFIDTKYSYSQLKENDVIVYTFKKQQVIHRVVKITEEGIETKGDSNSFFDRLNVTVKNYYGKCVIAIPWLGYAALLLQDQVTRIIFFGALLFLLFLQYFVNLKVHKLT